MWLYKLLTFISLWIGIQCLNTIFQENPGNNDVDLFISSYINELKHTLKLAPKEHNINKRSDAQVDLFELKGVELLVGAQTVFAVPSAYPSELVLFTECSSLLQDEPVWYAFALESHPDLEHTEHSNALVLYKLQEDTWEERDRTEVDKAVRVAVEQIKDVIYVIVTQDIARDDDGSTKVFYLHTQSNTLKRIQVLPTHFTSSVVTWKWENMDAFAAVAVSRNPEGSAKQYETFSPVYKWKGDHFDKICSLPTYNPQAIEHFTIDSSMFIVVANFQNELGERRVDSDVFVYDVAGEVCSVYQKLPTVAALDVKFFCVQSPQVTERFLIFASGPYADEEGRIVSNAPSVIYKLSEEKYFVPFQALHASHVTSWLPVRHVQEQDSLILLGAAEEGVISFQYDGWRFVPTGVHYDKTTFGPGPKTLNVFYNSNQPLISVANKLSIAGDYNVFSPVFRRDDKVEQIRNVAESLLEKLKSELDEVLLKMKGLLLIAQNSPSKNMSHIDLGNNVIFQNVEIENVETFTTKVGEDDSDFAVAKKLIILDNELQYIQGQLQNIHKKIDETSLDKRTMYQDTFEDNADIHCSTSCHVTDLVLEQINGENFAGLQENLVKLDVPLEVDGKLLFDKMALIDPLQVETINSHKVESLINWTKEIILDHDVKVDGNIIVKNNMLVGGLFDGVSINPGVTEHLREDEEVLSSVNYFNSLNASQLILLDGKISGVELLRIASSTLKVEGNQIIKYFNNFHEVFAEKLGNVDILDGIDTPPYIGEESSPGSQVLSPRSNEYEEVIVLPNNTVIQGVLMVEDGSISAEDLIDLKNGILPKNMSATGVLSNNIILNNNLSDMNSSMDVNMAVDSHDGKSLNLENEAHSDPVLAKKAQESKHKLIKNNTQEQSTSGKIFESLKIISLKSNEILLNGKNWQEIGVSKKEETLHLEKLLVLNDVVAQQVMVRGHINGYHLESLLMDTVFNGSSEIRIKGKKNFENEFKIHNLTLSVVNQTEANNLSQSLIPKYLSQAKVVNINKLYYKGYLDGVEANEFGHWLKSEGDQTVFGSQTIHSLEAENIEAGHFNSVNVSRLAFDSVFLTDNFTLDHAVFENTVSAGKVTIGKEMNGLKLPEDIVLKDTTEEQSEHLMSHKHLRGNLFINGRFVPNSLFSFSNVSDYCLLLGSPNAKVIIQGDATFEEEPLIANSIGNHKWTDLMNRIWLKYDDLYFSKLAVFQTQFENLIVENIYDENVSETLSKLVSVSKDQEIEGELYFTSVTVESGVDVERASIGGLVQGLNLPSFIQNVLLDGEEQNITGQPDFVSLIIDGNLDSAGSVNGLNLSSDVMLTNVESNEVESLTVEHLTTPEMTLPADALVAGVDLHKLHTHAARRSTPNTIIGDITFVGVFDTSSGLRVNGLVNNLHFDETSLMLKSKDQNITGAKLFSAHSKLNITKLEVKGNLNDISISEFYCDQVVTSEGDLTLTGSNQFTQPIHAARAVLPEIYQTHNLSRLETLLTFPLPWSRFQDELGYIRANKTLIEHSIAGKPYYLIDVMKIGEIKGNLPVLPLKEGNETVLVSLRQESDKIMMSLLGFNNYYKKFYQIPGSVKHVLNHLPKEVQSVTLANEDRVIYATTNQSSSLYEGGFGELIRLNSIKSNTISTHKMYRGSIGNKLLSFQNKKGNPCFIVLSMNGICDVSCFTSNLSQKKKWPSFSCENITEGAVVSGRSGDVYLVGLQTGYSNAVVIWRLHEKRVEFSMIVRTAVFNPVSLAAIATDRGPHIAVASRHLLGSSYPELINFFRFQEESHELVLESTVESVAPQKLLFARLPSAELVLYVASDNPATPVEVLVYRGVQGYQTLSVLSTLPVPHDINCFTDTHGRHFLLVHCSPNTTHVLQAQFHP